MFRSGSWLYADFLRSFKNSIPKPDPSNVKVAGSGTGPGPLIEPSLKIFV